MFHEVLTGIAAKWLYQLRLQHRGATWQLQFRSKKKPYFYIFESSTDIASQGY